MQTSDRPEFERQLNMLCRAYGVPHDAERSEAYWMAFNRLGLIEFARVVETAIGPDGPDKMPTTKQLWGIRKKLKDRPSFNSADKRDVLSALVETAMNRWPLTDAQRRMNWNWIARNPGQQDCAILGVIIPQDPKDPEHYPAHRLMVAEITQEATR